jgi:hypothetical protein
LNPGLEKVKGREGGGPKRMAVEISKDRGLGKAIFNNCHFLLVIVIVIVIMKVD